MPEPLESRRGQARLAALRFLYQWELNPGDDLQSAIEQQFKFLKVKTRIAEYAISLIQGAVLQLQQIDKIISENLTHWKLARLSVVDRNSMRLAVYEMMYVEDVPSRVSINEFVEISKRFGSADSPGFVNGVLDSIRTKLKKED
jgi:N utilization substance protein B